ncbi:hypothetical protein J7E62_31095 [Variovorax paradoxus]|nr:hypothetical protein [Variovorax paradoxus]
MRERAAALYITLGPSPLNIPVPADRVRYTPTHPKPVQIKLPGKPISTLSCRDRYREAFHPAPARPAPTTSMGRLLRRVETKLIAWI